MILKVCDKSLFIFSIDRPIRQQAVLLAVVSVCRGSCFPYWGSQGTLLLFFVTLVTSQVLLLISWASTSRTFVVRIAASTGKQGGTNTFSYRNPVPTEVWFDRIILLLIALNSICHFLMFCLKMEADASGVTQRASPLLQPLAAEALLLWIGGVMQTQAIVARGFLSVHIYGKVRIHGATMEVMKHLFRQRNRFSR